MRDPYAEGQPAKEAEVVASSPLVAFFLKHSHLIHQMVVSRDGIVRECNATLAASLKRAPSAVTGTPACDLLTDRDARWLQSLWESSEATRSGVRLVNFVDATQSPFTLNCCCEVQGNRLLLLGEPTSAPATYADEWLRMNNELAALSREAARKSKELAEAKAKLEQTVKELEGSYWHLKKIQEVLPICMRCNKVKAGLHWSDVAEYLRQHALFLSHGYCPECMTKVAAEWGLPEGTVSDD